MMHTNGPEPGAREKVAARRSTTTVEFGPAPEPAQPINCSQSGCGYSIIGYIDSKLKATGVHFYCAACAENEWQRVVAQTVRETSCLPPA